MWVLSHDWQAEVRVDRRVAMAREVLGARRDAGGLQARDPCERVAGDGGRLGTERADADDGVQRIGVHIGDGREVEVDAHLPQLGAHRTGNVSGERRVSRGSKCEVAGVGAARGRLEPRDVAALLIDGDHELWTLGVERRVQRGQLRSVRNVAPVQDDPAQPGRDATKQPVGRRLPGKTRQQASQRQGLELAHPLTAPAVNPPAR